MKGPQKVAKNHNDTGAHTASTSHVTKKPVTKGSKKSMKKVAHTSVSTKGKRHGSAKCETRAKSTSVEESSVYEYGNPVIVVSERDWNLVMETIENPPEPSPIMLKAVERYKECVET